MQLNGFWYDLSVNGLTCNDSCKLELIYIENKAWKVSEELTLWVGGVFDTPLSVGTCIVPRRQKSARTSPLDASPSREPEIVPKFPIK